MLANLDRKTIPALDGVRAVAVGIVMLGHFGIPGVHAGLGVLVFFVLSGFLITWLLLKEADRTGDISLRGFYSRRALRILPAFYAFLAFALSLLIVTKREINWAQVGSTLVYAANYYSALSDPGARNGVFSHIWSLAVEEQFYVLWPLAFCVLRRRGALLTYVLTASIGLVWVYRALLASSGVSARYLYRAFDTRADHLLIGCLLAVAMKRGLFEGFWNRITRAPWMPLVSVALVTCSVAYGARDPLYHYAIGYAIEPVLIGVGIIQVVALSSTRPWRWMDSRPVAWMGRISYSLYLFQAIGLGPYVLPGKPMWLRFVVCQTVTFAMAAASYYVIERPFLRLKDRRPRPAAIGLRTDPA